MEVDRKPLPWAWLAEQEVCRLEQLHALRLLARAKEAAMPKTKREGGKGLGRGRGRGRGRRDAEREPSSSEEREPSSSEDLSWFVYVGIASCVGTLLL